MDIKKKVTKNHLGWKRICYVDEQNRKQGQSIWYGENNTIWIVREYEDDILLRKKWYRRDGSLRLERIYDKNVSRGYSKEIKYSFNGNKLYENSYKNKKLHGKCILYDSYGNVRLERNYINGKEGETTLCFCQSKTKKNKQNGNTKKRK